MSVARDWLVSLPEGALVLREEIGAVVGLGRGKRLDRLVAELTRQAALIRLGSKRGAAFMTPMGILEEMIATLPLLDTMHALVSWAKRHPDTIQITGQAAASLVLPNETVPWPTNGLPTAAARAGGREVEVLEQWWSVRRTKRWTPPTVVQWYGKSLPVATLEGLVLHELWWEADRIADGHWSWTVLQAVQRGPMLALAQAKGMPTVARVGYLHDLAAPGDPWVLPEGLPRETWLGTPRIEERRMRGWERDVADRWRVHDTRWLPGSANRP